MSRAENFYKEKIKSAKDKINILENYISYIGWSRLAIVLVGIVQGINYINQLIF